ncbi:ribonuclease H-like domain-containing protein [Tanacetum coccineum]
MSEFCEKKGIKKEFSIARTPQQNGVTKRRNRTLIEAARTMLADSKLPTTFWAEAVNTACYVQNRVLIVKPHNKTPYELFGGRTPTLSFMRPFGCHVTILNTLDYLGKFDGKSDEGFFVGYSMNSEGPKWLFDIDVLTKSMNYVSVVAGTNSNDLVDIGSPGVVRPEHEGLPWMLDDPYVQLALQAPPLPDYIPSPEEPHSPPLPDFVPEPIYPKYMPQEDEVFLAEEQPLPVVASPTAQSPDYVPESDPEADPEEDDEEDPEEDPDDEDDDEVDIEADDDEEEHPAPAYSVVVALPAADQALSTEEIKPISIPALPTPVWSDAEVARLLAISTPPSSPLSPWSSPLPQIPSPPLPLIPSPLLSVSPPLPVSSPVPVLSPSPPASPIRPLGYRAAMIRQRAEAASTSHSLPLPPPIILSYTRLAAPSSGTPPLHLLSTDRREDITEVTLPPQKRLGIALGPAYKVGESSSAVAARPTGGLRADYGFVATMDREIRRDPERDVRY